MRDPALLLYTSAVMAILVASRAYSDEELFKPEVIGLPSSRGCARVYGFHRKSRATAIFNPKPISASPVTDLMMR